MYEVVAKNEVRKIEGFYAPYNLARCFTHEEDAIAASNDIRYLKVCKLI